MEQVELLILGDICPTKDTRSLFDAGRSANIFGSLRAHMRSADLTVANLECVLSDSAQGIEKIGPVLIGKSADAKLLADAGIGLLGVANNHIGDCGGQGVMDTLRACQDAGIETVGAGVDSSQAANANIVEKNGLKIGFFAVAEHEFNAASVSTPGANIFDALQDLERIADIKAECDFLVVLYHGGIEHYPYPSPRLMRSCRSMVRHGADLVLCQHSHLIGAAEEYLGGTILYGQGNSVYGHRKNMPTWNLGLAVAVSLSRSPRVDSGFSGRELNVELSYIPIGCEEFGAVNVLEAHRAKKCLDDLALRSSQIQDEQWVEHSWKAFSRRIGVTHLPHVLGLGKVMTRLNRISRGLIVRLLYTRRMRLVSMNVIRCDAHREVLETAFANSLIER